MITVRVKLVNMMGFRISTGLKLWALLGGFNNVRLTEVGRHAISIQGTCAWVVNKKETTNRAAAFVLSARCLWDTM